VLLNSQSNLLVRKKTYQVNTPTLSEPWRYSIPERAIGRAIKSVRYTGMQNPLVYDTSENVSDYVQGQPSKVVIEDDSFLLSPYPTIGSLTVEYFVGVSKMVEVSTCARVTAFDLVAKTITVDTVQGSFLTGTYLDIVNKNSGNNFVNIDANILNVDTVNKILTLDSLSDRVKVGDYVSLSEMTCVLPLPVETFPFIVKAVCAKILLSQGDVEAYQMFKGEVEQARKLMLSAFFPRLLSSTPRVAAGPFSSFSNFNNLRTR
jgi:hypothetical protein